MREATVLRAIDGSDVPHPHVVTACDDLHVVGRPFLVMEFVDGFAPRDPLPAAYASPEQRRALAVELVDTLVTIRNVEWSQKGLQDYGRPQNFLERQVQRWMGQLDSYRTRDIEGLDTLARWLEDNRPPAWTAGLMHGDYSFFNVLMSKQPPARMLAVVDWESSTIGDPLMDLGWLIGHWRHADEAPLLDHSVTHLDGMPRRSELLERYAMRAPLDATTVPYYAALALFKMACILEGSYARYRSGRSSHPQHAVFEHTVPQLIAVAVDFVTGARPL
jgi:aminoglycoside phosphotransferase (APT) family kinase protein